jgi:membrane protein involved in colicin uptake
MKKLYVVLPVIGVLIFGAFFWRFNADFEAREASKKDAQRVEREAKVRADLEAKKKAIEEAIALQEKRKIEKAEREKRAEEEKQAQLDLKDASDRARDDRDRVLRQVDRLKTEISVEESALKKLASDKANLIAEDEFLLKYVKLAEDNQKSLEEILAKIEKVDKDAAIAAAQSAKKKS